MSDRLQVVLLSIITFLLVLGLIKVADAIDCQIKQSSEPCSAVIFKASSPVNAHAELSTQNNYNYNVCCEGTAYSVDNSCLSGFNFLKLSGATNAHVQQNSYTDYTTNICLASAGTVNCDYTTQPTQSCIDIGYDTCIATISSSTNAHVSDCTINPYPIKICCKTDCAGSITGTVTEQDDQQIEGALINAKIGLTDVSSAYTNEQGIYTIGNIVCGTYTLTASHPDYLPQTKNNIVVNHQQTTTVDFELIRGSSCEADCTFANDNIVHASCDGKNGCTFCNIEGEEEIHEKAKQICDNSQPGWVRDYDENNYIICPEGCPQTNVKISASVSCSSGTLVKVTRIVLYKGKPVRLNVATCK
ncbi:carboxypeptidase regulatory-like domain-containing protein [Candidatus Woesearchaeota archaeon]|nr:carboxypeptidase regulatory-like domain-containing protein [Candidatus Woesearchaeota archaeon]